jgi:protein-L-isoaspartate(D-aspartate) O-methyltransferase
MVTQQLRQRGIEDVRVLQAMCDVPRHLFVPVRHRAMAYEDTPLSIGYEQTISQPLMVAMMTAAAQLQGQERVLEIGTGSGYQAAILSRLALVVFSIERIPELAAQARATLAVAGMMNVHVLVGDGSLGLPEHGPYEAIIIGQPIEARWTTGRAGGRSAGTNTHTCHGNKHRTTGRALGWMPVRPAHRATRLAHRCGAGRG